MSVEAAAPPAMSVTASRRKVFWVLLVVGALAIIIWRLVFATPKTPDNVIVLSRRIEGDDSVIAPKASGRIAEIRFREGDIVKAGDTIALLDDQQVRARQEQARAALAVSEARERAARSQLGMLQEQLEQSQIQTIQATTDAEGRV